jgi:hypothetical protein
MGPTIGTGAMRHWRCSLLTLGILMSLLSAPLPAAEEPDYPHGEFQDDCTNCHSSESWTPAIIGPDFDHAKRGFLLRGAHATAACRACHVSLDFSGVTRACVSCHLDAHISEFGTECDRCHTEISFIDRARMSRAHQTTRFPLVGTHRVIDCEQCHPLPPQGQMQYVKTPVDCQACHLDEYLATTDPDHQAAGFSTACELCHIPTIWRQILGGIDHDGPFFPIFSGRHRGQWTSCSDCHFNPQNFSDFSCILCHEHSDQAEVDGQHSGVPGYVYDGRTCYNCHPRGEAD